jgi:hypothetical protein
MSAAGEAGARAARLLRARTKTGALSNTENKQLNRCDANHQHREGDFVVFKPMPNLRKHGPVSHLNARFLLRSE